MLKTLFVLGKLAGFKANRDAANEELRQAYQQAYDLRLEADAVVIKGAEQHNALMKDRFRNEGTNTAWYSFAGRDMSDRSVKAFLEENLKTSQTDVARLDSATTIKSRLLRSSADEVERTGRARKSIASLSALTEFATDMYTYRKEFGL
tara:strand:- start:130 stop:576 length:447 start_codon:yes stop_codon:yes gene_type:complete